MEYIYLKYNMLYLHFFLYHKHLKADINSSKYHRSSFTVRRKIIQTINISSHCPIGHVFMYKSQFKTVIIDSGEHRSGRRAGGEGRHEGGRGHFPARSF